MHKECKRIAYAISPDGQRCSIAAALLDSAAGKEVYMHFIQ
jgi:hypothetical protein